MFDQSRTKEENEDGHMVIRHRECEKSAAPPKRCFAGACVRCFSLTNKTKLIKIIMEWCERLDYVRLVHMCLGGDFAGQADLAHEMAEKYELISGECLAKMNYGDLLTLTRAKFQHIGQKYMNDALKKFLQVNLDFLSKGLQIGVPQEVRPHVQAYVEAIVAGDVGATEIRLTKLISQGALKYDSICRALVPALLSKADKIRRGHSERTGSSEVDQTGLVELSFALGQSMNLTPVQKALGLSRRLQRIQFMYFILCF